MNDSDDVEPVVLADELAAVRDSEPDAGVAEPEDCEVPPSGVLPPDPTGLGALA